MGEATVGRCPGCRKRLRVPADRPVARVTCPACRHSWAWQPPGPESPPPTDYYELLQVSPTADAEIVEAAYRRLALRHHPDRNPGDEAARRVMVLLNEAHAVLTDPARRAAYDAARQPGRAAAAERPHSPHGGGNSSPPGGMEGDNGPTIADPRRSRLWKWAGHFAGFGCCGAIAGLSEPDLMRAVGVGAVVGVLVSVVIVLIEMERSAAGVAVLSAAAATGAVTAAATCAVGHTGLGLVLGVAVGGLIGLAVGRAFPDLAAPPL